MRDHIGQQLGNYRLINLLGQGGFAEVHLGEHVFLKTKAAIKILHTQLAGDDMEGFLQEARTIANLVHPHIVRVLEFGLEGKTPFLVMDYAPSGTLRQRHPKGSLLPLPTIVSYVKQIASALQYAHDQKLVHRDIKPENMLIGRHGEVLLSDFGIALTAQSSRYQSTQDVVGTVAYMSPEQIQGKPRPASDQYSLAIVVYEWLCGDRPFHGSFTELCAQHVFASPPPLQEKLPMLPPEVQRVVETALAKDPKQRFGSVQAFANALEQASLVQQATPSLPANDIPATQFAPPPVAPSPSRQTVAPFLPPTQYATSPAPQMTIPSISDKNAAEVSPVTELPVGEPAPAAHKVEKVNLWKLEKRQWVAMAVGVLLCGGLCFLLYPSDPRLNVYFAFGSLYGYYYRDPIQSVATLLCLVEATFLFLGTAFGPWAGLCTAGITGFVADYFLTAGFRPDIWYDYYTRYCWVALFRFAFIGFIAGLAFIVTKGHYNNRRSIAIAAGISTIGLIVMTIIGALIIQYSIFPGLFSIPSISILLIPGLVLLPILLFVYNKMTERMRLS